MNVYLAAPLFTLAERLFNTKLATALRGRSNMSLIVPQERAGELIKLPNGLRLVFDDCISMVAQCDAVVAILDGADADSGTCIELGYALALRKPIVGVRTDFRGSEDRGLNLMVSYSCTELLSESAGGDVDALATKIHETLERITS